MAEAPRRDQAQAFTQSLSPGRIGCWSPRTGVRTMWLPPTLLLLFLPGSSGAREPISGPETERGPERGNLSVRCRYGQGWETYKKYWCRGAAWSHCEILLITTASEQEVRQGRVTIRDHHRSRTFTVTMEQLREDDADIYWCGMERVGADPGVQVKVIVDPAPTTVLTTSPTTVTSTTNTSVVPNTVSTPLSSTWRETYSSSTVSRHSGEGRRIEATFLCCGEGPSATSFSPDLAHTNSRTQRPSLKPAGSSNAREPISGPETVRGPERGNLSVQCHYGRGWETYKKYWCRGAVWSHCKILIITTGSEQEVRQGRVSIRDHHRSRTFTVTMEQLREDDAGTYWCGMERVGADFGVQVKVIVDSGMKTTTDLSPTPPVTETSGGQHVPPTRSWLSSDHSLNLFLLPIFLKLPLLLGTLGAVLWVSMWWRSPEWQAEPAQWELAAAVPDQTERPSMKTESFH
ncbi:polymeric immunoglobulin receptor-like [Ochotona curzoniae]|uniref:polymeric immunoglobulin receptor-like n=1 Tax=Ochotona curzoniae TaxID=130825 RepID=UPI001B3529ED|nr:polymeric immunoglobulin receptor-like [Ochotona curzoniae]